MKKRLFYSTVAAFMIFPSLAMADEADQKKMKTLDEVVVTATRAAKDIKTVPANITVITADEIRDSGASSIVEVLQNQANIHIRTFSGNPAQAQIDLRGFGENGFGRTLVLLDGRRLNRIDMSSITWTQLPLEQIERIEVVRGSGSVLYGDAAVAGVIHIITKKGALESSISASLQIGEDNFHDERVGLMGSSDKFSYSVSAANQQTDGWRDRTAFKSYGGGFQLGYDIADYLSISGGASYNKTDFEMPGSLTKDELAQDRTQPQPGHTADESENEYQNANFLIEGSLGNSGDIEVNLVYGNSDISSNILSYWPPAQFNLSDSESIGVQPKYVLDSEHGSFSNQLVTGVDIYQETLTVDKYSDASRQNKTHSTDLERNTIGWYVRDEITIGDNIILGGGGRIERAEISGRSITLNTSIIDFDEDKEHDGEVFEVGATWLPVDNMKLYTRYSTVYRYPFIDEQATFYGFGSDTFLSDLEAEEGQSIEAGFGVTPIENFTVGFTIFQIDMEDEISWNEITYRNENLDDTRHRGLEMSLDYKLLEILSLQMNYTYQKATFESGNYSGNEVPLVPNNLIAANLDLTLMHSLHLLSSIKYVDDSYLSQDFDNNTEKLDDYFVFDLLLRYKKDIGRTQWMTFLGIANLFDEEYSTHGTDNQSWGGENTYFPSPGRKFYGGISTRF
jgi:iron complex outermembrane receptor protein